MVRSRACNLIRSAIIVAVCYLVTLSPCHLVNRAAAHPVIGDHHDRTVHVRVAPAIGTGKVVVTVALRLEVNPFTAFQDMKPFADQVPLSWQKTDPDKFYDGYARCYAPRLASWLVATGDDQSLKFTYQKSSHTLRDDKGQLLGHVRFDLVFQTTYPLRPGERQRFALEESEWLEWKGRIDLSLTAVGVEVVNLIEPSAALKAKSPLDYRPGEMEQLRRVALTFQALDPPFYVASTVGLLSSPDGQGAFLAASAVIAGKTRTQASASKSTPPTATDRQPTTSHKPQNDDHADILGLFLHSEHGVWLLLLLSAGIGAVHALTPGHGKTLVAAYLVGQRGTVWHALMLGLVTTITHTGVVLVLALGLWWFFPTGMTPERQRSVQTGLGLIMGLLVAGLGFWLLLQRLAGRADHIHLGGGHHHHHHHHGANVPIGLPPAERVGWWGLVVLGMSGGIVPCWDAVAMLLVAVGMNLVWLALPMLLAFSAGLAGVLVLIGVLVVQVRRFANSRMGEGRLVRALPLISAASVFVLGCWLCYASVR